MKSEASASSCGLGQNRKQNSLENKANGVNSDREKQTEI